MNLDELCNTVISADQQIYVPASSSSSTTDVAPVPGNYNLNDGALICKTDNNLNDGALICKTDNNLNGGVLICSDEKPAIFGQTILEDFLFRTGSINLGICRAEGESKPLLDPVVRQHADWMDYQLVADQQHQHEHQQQRMALLRSNMPIFGNGVLSGGFTENQQLGMPGTPLISMGMVRPTSSNLPTPTETNRSDENVDKSIERRQKRMIKNRESAARSRAKKQAYINHLEEATNKLARENEWLRKQKEVEEMLSHFNAIPEPRHQLRRTSSWSF